MTDATSDRGRWQKPDQHCPPDASVEVQDSRVFPNLLNDPETSPDTRATLDLELRESEERYRTLFDLVPVAVSTGDRAGVIQNFNRRAAELWGREPAYPCQR